MLSGLVRNQHMICNNYNYKTIESPVLLLRLLLLLLFEWKAHTCSSFPFHKTRSCVICLRSVLHFSILALAYCPACFSAMMGLKIRIILLDAAFWVKMLSLRLWAILWLCSAQSINTVRFLWVQNKHTTVATYSLYFCRDVKSWENLFCE